MQRMNLHYKAFPSVAAVARTFAWHIRGFRLRLVFIAPVGLSNTTIMENIAFL
ncbi:MAG: hypothetical protein IJS08_19255 [Victivallales bacterium]|nr:hypothetical protein [Victivallales bacterium]